MNFKELIEAAVAVRKRAYAPYSKFLVGAALLTKSGKVFAGCNVENVSFGLTLCAERCAVANAVASGDRDFEAIAVVTDSQQPAMPCGACLQVLAEFAPNISVIVAGLSGDPQQFDLSELLPEPTHGILGEHHRV